MKRMSLFMLCLSFVSSVFADVDRVVSEQISKQITRSTAESISKNLERHRLSARTDSNVSLPSGNNAVLNHQKETAFSNDKNVPTDSYPNTSGFSR